MIKQHLLVAHPYPDLYGADQMLLVSLEAFRDAGFDPLVLVPESGPLEVELARRGFRYEERSFPVLRKELLHPRGMTGLVACSWRATRSLCEVIRETKPALVYV